MSAIAAVSKRDQFAGYQCTQCGLLSFTATQWPCSQHLPKLCLLLHLLLVCLQSVLEVNKRKSLGVSAACWLCRHPVCFSRCSIFAVSVPSAAMVVPRTAPTFLQCYSAETAAPALQQSSKVPCSSSATQQQHRALMHRRRASTRDDAAIHALIGRHGSTKTGPRDHCSCLIEGRQQNKRAWLAGEQEEKKVTVLAPQQQQLST